MSEKIVILGGGYSGLQTAIELDKLGLECTLVDRSDTHELLPELPHKITDLDLKTEVPFAELLSSKSKVKFIKDTVEKIDYKNNKVLLASKDEIPFTRLVISLGTNVNYFNIPGLEENSLTFHSTKDVHGLLEHIKAKFKEAKNHETTSHQYKELLTVVIGGGGLTGVEVLGELIAELPKIAKQNNLNPKDVKIYLVEALDKLLQVLDSPISKKVTDFYKRIKDVELLLGIAIDAVKPDAVHLADGRTVMSKTIIWTGGIRGSKFLDKPFINKDGEEDKFKVGRGFRLEVDEYYRVKGVERTYASGDNALIIDTETGHPFPQNGQAAYKQGKALAHYIKADMEAKTITPKPIKLDGLLVSLGPKYGTGMIINPFTFYLPINRIARKMKKMIELRYKCMDIRR